MLEYDVSLLYWEEEYQRLCRIMSVAESVEECLVIRVTKLAMAMRVTDSELKRRPAKSVVQTSHHAQLPAVQHNCRPKALLAGSHQRIDILVLLSMFDYNWTRKGMAAGGSV